MLSGEHSKYPTHDLINKLKSLKDDIGAAKIAFPALEQQLTDLEIGINNVNTGFENIDLDSIADFNAFLEQKKHM